MYTGRIAGLGVLPVAVPIIANVMLTMLKMGASADAAAAAMAEQYEEFYRAKEAEVSQLALYLGRETDIPYWEWFNILRSIQRLGPPVPPISLPDGNGGNGGNGADDKKTGLDTTTLIIGALALVLVLKLGGR